MVDVFRDPLFQQVASDYMRNLISTYGTDHFYGDDGFFSNERSPWMGAVDAANKGRSPGAPSTAADGARMPPLLTLSSPSPTPPPPPPPPPPTTPAPTHPMSWWHAHAKGAYAGMSEVDPDATWIYQSYSWHQFIYYHRGPDLNNTLKVSPLLTWSAFEPVLSFLGWFWKKTFYPALGGYRLSCDSRAARVDR